MVVHDNYLSMPRSVLCVQKVVCSKAARSNAKGTKAFMFDKNCTKTIIYFVNKTKKKKERHSRNSLNITRFNIMIYTYEYAVCESAYIYL